jgi:hypothetical protein
MDLRYTAEEDAFRREAETLRPQADRLVPLFDRWLPGAGFEWKRPIA